MAIEDVWTECADLASGLAQARLDQTGAPAEAAQFVSSAFQVASGEAFRRQLSDAAEIYETRQERNVPESARSVMSLLEEEARAVASWLRDALRREPRRALKKGLVRFKTLLDSLMDLLESILGPWGTGILTVLGEAVDLVTA